jgi:hypothetical protein
MARFRFHGCPENGLSTGVLSLLHLGDGVHFLLLCQVQKDGML